MKSLLRRVVLDCWWLKLFGKIRCQDDVNDVEDDVEDVVDDDIDDDVEDDVEDDVDDDPCLQSPTRGQWWLELTYEESFWRLEGPVPASRRFVQITTKSAPSTHSAETKAA